MDEKLNKVFQVSSFLQSSQKCLVDIGKIIVILNLAQINIQFHIIIYQFPPVTAAVRIEK